MVVFFFFAWIPGGDAGCLGHFWTLAIEEQVYLVWPVVVFALSRAALMRVCVVSMAAAAALRWVIESQGVSSFMVTFCRVDTLLLGALLALAARSSRGLIHWSASAVAVGLVTLLVALPLHATLGSTGSIGLQVVKYPLIAVFYSAILVIGVTASRTTPAGRLLNLRPLRSLGKYSFGIYVYHPFWIGAAGGLFEKASTALVLSEVYAAPVFALKFALIFGASFATAWLSWHLYEKRFLVTLFLTGLSLLFLAFFFHQFHCLDCGATDWLFRYRRHACPSIVARYQNHAVRRFRIPNVATQITIWFYLLGGALLLGLLVLRARR